MGKNLKHGLKVTKRDIINGVRYVVAFDEISIKKVFYTKLDAVNYITSLLDNGMDKSFINLYKVSNLKFY